MNDNYGMYPEEYEHDMKKPRDHLMHHERLLRTLADCEATCEHMTTIIKRRNDVNLRTRQLSLLRDCADICGLTYKYIARNSMFSRHIASLCAQICTACGNECARFPDAESQHCARICLNCAIECRNFSMMYM